MPLEYPPTFFFAQSPMPTTSSTAPTAKPPVWSMLALHVVPIAGSVAALSTFYGNRNVLLGALVSIVVPIAIFFVFSRVLGVSLPEATLF